MHSPQSENPARLSEEEVAELERLEKAATPGPWVVAGPRFNEWIETGDGARLFEPSTECMDADEALVVATRAALPRLLSERAASSQRVAKLRAALEGVVFEGLPAYGAPRLIPSEALRAALVSAREALAEDEKL